MSSFRFLHAADLHLDTPFSGMSGVPDRLRRYLQESTFAAFAKLVDLAIAEAVDFIVLSGDIYDASDSSLRAQLRLREAWDKLGRHGVPVYLIHGNHDPLDTRRLRLPHPQHVTVFGPEAGSVTAVRRSDGQPVAVVSGVSYPSAAVTDNLSRQFHRGATSRLYHIALLHANVDGQEGHDAYAPCSLRDLESSGYDYWALGHIHKRQILSQSPWVVYPGNIQGRSFRETGPKGCYIVHVEDTGKAKLKFHELGQVLWIETEVPIAGLDSEEAWKLRVEEKLEEVRDANEGKLAVLRLKFTGRGPLNSLLQSGRESADLLQELRRREAERLEHPERIENSFPQSIVWPADFKVNTGMSTDRDRLTGEDSFLGELLRLGDKAREQPDLLDSIMDSALASLADHRMLRKLLKDFGPQERLDLLHRAEELASSLLAEGELGEGGNP